MDTFIKRRRTNRSNIAGRKFGLLTAVKMADSPTRRVKWLCICECGKEAIVAIQSLFHPTRPTKSCGCLKGSNNKYRAIDLTGRRIGKLTVIDSEIVNKNGKSYRYWRCVCECGCEIKSITGNLTKGNTTSCGCSRILHNELAAKRFVFRRYRTAAKANGREFTLSLYDVAMLIAQPCIYCGIMNSNALTSGRGNREPFLYNGIDRKDNEIGYTKENSMPCCRGCNFAKGVRTHDEFMKWIARIVRHNAMCVGILSSGIVSLDAKEEDGIQLKLF